MRRIASIIGLPESGRLEYERLHAHVFPEVLERMSASNIVNYSIFRHDELLFSYLEYIGDDFESDMAAVSADPSTQAWWALCSPLQRPLGSGSDGEWWKPIPEIFHME